MCSVICEIDRRFVSYKRLFSLENQNGEASAVVDLKPKVIHHLMTFIISKSYQKNSLTGA